MAVSIYEALDLIKKNKKVLQTQIIPIEDASLRVCAQDIFCSISLPTFDNSAMDGYAICCSDLEKEVEIVETILAGDEIKNRVKQGKAIKVMTGSAIPKGTESVVPFELTTKVGETKVKLPKTLAKGANIRYIGEDINEGEPILLKGDMIDYAHIGLLASQGITHIKVYKKPKVAVFASGSELKMHYEKLEQNQIYNSNTPSLIALASNLGCDTTFIGKSADDISQINTLIHNAKDADLIVTSGGVSTGEADFTKEAFKKCGFKELFSKIDIKPGKPTTYGLIGDTQILNLPGNPLASMINFEIFGRSIIYGLLGLNKTTIGHIKTKISHEFKHKKGRNSVFPGFFDGESFQIAKKYAPGMVNVLNRCNAFMVLDKDVDTLKKDQTIKIILTGFVFSNDKNVDFINKSCD